MGFSATTKHFTSSDIIGPTAAYVLIRDEKSDGTAGGTATSGAWRTRDLNTIVTDETNQVTLDSNEFTLPSGKWRFDIAAPAFRVTGNQARLFNVTDNEVVDFGNSSFNPANSAGDGSHNDPARVVGQFEINAAKAFRVEHLVQTTEATNGFGLAAGVTGQNEIYTVVQLWRIPS